MRFAPASYGAEFASILSLRCCRLVPALEKQLAARVGLRLLFASIPRCDTLREDLKRAGIAYKDAEGRQADFHSLRHATSTHLGASHAAPRAQMSMMRHQDMKLTMGTYTDEAHISRREAIEKLPNILDLTAVPWTHPRTHGIVVSRPSESLPVATDPSDEETQLPFMQASKRVVTPVVAAGRKGRKAAALGLEPPAHTSQVTDSITGCKTASKPSTHGLTHDPDFHHLASHWDDLPDSLRKEIVELSRSWPQDERP